MRGAVVHGRINSPWDCFLKSGMTSGYSFAVVQIKSAPGLPHHHLSMIVSFVVDMYTVHRCVIVKLEFPIGSHLG